MYFKQKIKFLKIPFVVHIDNNPVVGYGIFIENMLSEAEKE